MLSAPECGVVESNYIAQYDAEPEFWQFLNNLTHEDLIAELVQNELDAGSTRTSIRFEEDRLICEGNGKPVDGEGWIRLSFIRGAGKDAPRKRERIGVKNHGLKTCFRLGDEIVIRSDGKLTKQTLYRNGVENDPAPGTFKGPVPDRGAPERGCRIEVPYRTTRLVARYSEPFEFDAPDRQSLENIFRRACAEIPERFIGVIRPGMRSSYTIELSHHQLGSGMFEFRCTAARPVRGGKVFMRSCTSRGDGAVFALAMREEAFVFGCSLPPASTHEIPLFYKAHGGFLAEVAWRVDARRKPNAVSGHLRYPITYTGTGGAARSGVGVHYSGPFISDQDRHGVSAASFNPIITAACDAALIAILRDHLIPKCGARALRLLVDPRSEDDERLREMTTALLAANAVPLARRERRRVQFGAREVAGGAVRPVVVPVYLWEPRRIVQTLVNLCPKEADRIDSEVPSEIVELLADEDLPGWKITHVTFDQTDVLPRMQPTRVTGFFPWPDEAAWHKELGNPRLAGDYLDVLLAICDDRAPSSQEIRALREGIRLPDTRGTARPLSELFVGNELPPALASLEMPALLHTTLAKHRLFKRRDWKLRVYSFEEFLEKVDFSQHSDATRRTFLMWLRKNWKLVPKKSASRLAALPVWPAREGGTRTLNALCLPRRAIAEVLSGAICLPAAEVEGLRALRRKGRGALVLRSAPSSAELETYYSTRIDGFPSDRQLSLEEAESFRWFERDLTTLAGDRQIAAWLSRQIAVGLSRDRHITPMGKLHRETPQVASLALLSGDLLDRASRVLDGIFPPRSEVSLRCDHARPRTRWRANQRADSAAESIGRCLASRGSPRSAGCSDCMHSLRGAAFGASAIGVQRESRRLLGRVEACASGKEERR